MTEHKFNGLLFLDENDLSRMNYKVKDMIDKTEKSISAILDIIYNDVECSLCKLIRVVGRFYNNSALPFSEFQQLRISKDEYGTNSYYIGTFPLEIQLHKHLGENLELLIEDYTDATKDIGLFHPNPYSDIRDTTEDLKIDTRKT